MELKNVKMFVMAAEYLSFSKVAELTYTSQSSVSKYISMLEDELDDELFIRDGRGVVLSDFGAAFLPYAKEILAKERDSLNALRNFRKGQKYFLLRIGIDTTLTVSPPDIFFMNLIKSINTFRAEAPHVALDIKYYESNELYSFLKNNRLDVIITLLSNHQAEEKAWQNSQYYCLDCSKNFLAVPPSMDTTGSFESLLSRINTLLYAKDHMPQAVTYSFMNEYGVSAGIEVCAHWSELFFRILFGEGVAVLPDNMKKIIAGCGIKVVGLPGFSVQSGLYLMWQADKTNENSEKFISSMKSAYK